MNKKIVFVGGVNGCGKTKLTEELSSRFGCFIGKQKRAMIAVAKDKGMAWETIPAHYEELIEATADRLAQDFSASSSKVMFIDCHYAFKLNRAVKMNLDKVIEETDEPYLQAIDDRVIQRLSKEFEVAFVFVEVDPQIALERVNDRAKNIGDTSSTHDYLAGYQQAERQFYDAIVTRMGAVDNSLVITNNSSISATTETLREFIGL